MQYRSANNTIDIHWTLTWLSHVTFPFENDNEEIVDVYVYISDVHFSANLSGRWQWIFFLFSISMYRLFVSKNIRRLIVVRKQKEKRTVKKMHPELGRVQVPQVKVLYLYLKKCTWYLYFYLVMCTWYLYVYLMKSTWYLYLYSVTDTWYLYLRYK
jgi:hypothetical protein